MYIAADFKVVAGCAITMLVIVLLVRIVYDFRLVADSLCGDVFWFHRGVMPLSGGACVDSWRVRMVSAMLLHGVCQGDVLRIELRMRNDDTEPRTVWPSGVVCYQHGVALRAAVPPMMRTRWWNPEYARIRSVMPQGEAEVQSLFRLSDRSPVTVALSDGGFIGVVNPGRIGPGK
ncbi:hypothetical protein [Bifidobacterium miconisargentati]|uniref:hypothetical protein n=1 Tax=Bifidobacterium miconisargentati TaxID=2834437 RepID=UPI001BDC3034|nr:hypothetical protein [Bifidobacterium miconisargentati]MBW3089244.1 hypothetical protein [Bifidobacterium miconisargentati]